MMERLIDEKDLIKLYDENDRLWWGSALDDIQNLPTVEAIPKEEYENRLKADMVAMLTDLQSEIEELDFFKGEEPVNITQALIDEVRSWEYGVNECKGIIQQKINALKSEDEPQESEGNK